MVGLVPRAKDCCKGRKLKQLKVGTDRGESQRNSPSTPANSLRQSPLLASVCLVVCLPIYTIGRRQECLTCGIRKAPRLARDERVGVPVKRTPLLSPAERISDVLFRRHWSRVEPLQFAKLSLREIASTA